MMDYKTILVHLDTGKHCARRVAVAIQLARTFDAHLVGLAPTGEATIPYWDESSQATAIIIDVAAALRERADAAGKAFEQQVSQAAPGHTHELRMDRNEAAFAVVQHARYSDLVVLGQTDPDETQDTVAAHLLVRTLLGAGKPVLLVPYAGHFEQVGRRILVAWDGGREAARAMTDALPFLRRAERVVVLVVNPDPDTHGAQPGADIALFLARHQIKPEVLVKTAKDDAAATICATAHEMVADLIVMGGYGHTRLREFVVGGVTRSMLSAMKVPVLMAH